MTDKLFPPTPSQKCSCGYPDQPCAKTQSDCVMIQPSRSGPVVCNLAGWFNAPDVGYRPHYGRKKRSKQ